MFRFMMGFDERRSRTSRSHSLKLTSLNVSVAWKPFPSFLVPTLCFVLIGLLQTDMLYTLDVSICQTFKTEV